MAENSQCALQAVVQVDLLAHHALVVGELLNRHHQIGDASNALFNGANQRNAGDQRFKPVQRIGKTAGIECHARALQLIRPEADFDQGGSDCESVFHSGRRQPLGHCFFGIGLLQAAQGRSFAAGDSLLEQAVHAFQLFRRLGRAAVAQRDLLQAAQVFSQLSGSTLGSRSGIMQLVHQPCGKRAQRHQLLAVQGFNLVGLQALRYIGQHRGAHRGAARQHIPKFRFVKADQNRIGLGKDAEERDSAAGEQWNLAKTFAGLHKADARPASIFLGPLGIRSAVKHYPVITGG